MQPVDRLARVRRLAEVADDAKGDRFRARRRRRGEAEGAAVGVVLDAVFVLGRRRERRELHRVQRARRVEALRVGVVPRVVAHRRRDLPRRRVLEGGVDLAVAAGHLGPRGRPGGAQLDHAALRADERAVVRRPRHMHAVGRATRQVHLLDAARRVARVRERDDRRAADALRRAGDAVEVSRGRRLGEAGGERREQHGSPAASQVLLVGFADRAISAISTEVAASPPTSPTKSAARRALPGHLALYGC